MVKIVISGYYGFNNLGDEAILETMVNSLKKLNIQNDIYVLTGNLKETKRNIDVNVVHRSKFFDVIFAIAKSDVFISGGGSLLQDSTGRWSIRYYLALIWWAIVCRKKVFLYAHGIGPVSGKFNRFLMKIILKYVDIITVRDIGSKEELLLLGIKDKKIYLSADPVIAMEKSGKKIGSEILKKSFDSVSVDYDNDKPLIAFSLRAKDFCTNENRQMLKKLIKSLMSDYRVIFLPFHLVEDRELCIWANRQNIPAITSMIGAKEMMSVVENADLLVGERLHSLIFAAVAGISFLGISYDPKIDAFMQIFDMKAICSVGDFIRTDIKSNIDDAFAKDGELLEEQNRKVDSLKSGFEINTKLLESCLYNCRED